MNRSIFVAVCLCLLAFDGVRANDLFSDQVAPILARRCLSCHDNSNAKGDFTLESASHLVESGHVLPGDVDASYLVELITPVDGVAEMPKQADPLASDEIAVLRRWIEQGAKIPDGFEIEPPVVQSRDWWSLQPLEPLTQGDRCDAASIDRMIDKELDERGLTPVPPADPATLLRRLSYDLAGLPPTPQQIDAFCVAYRRDPERTWTAEVDRLLAAPAFGEAFARRWLDVARYAETHGYDKDQPRRNAWPYRDYVIAAFRSDKPVDVFVREQIAGDTLAADQSEGIRALGFLAAGPWDLIAHVEVGEGKLDGRIAKHLDRDEMVSAVFNIFQSTTIQCAQCHNHKFDPISSEAYYQVHAVFAGVDRADRAFEQPPPEVQEASERLTAERDRLQKTLQTIVPTEHGYHSRIEGSAKATKWLQVDLGHAEQIDAVELIACFDDFNDIGEGFGFPVRFQIQVTDQATFDLASARTLVDHTGEDFANPGCRPQTFPADGLPIRLIRLTATKLAERANDFILAMGEVRAIQEDRNIARDGVVTYSDAIPANARWNPAYLVDGKYYRDSRLSADMHAERTQQIAMIEKQLRELPKPQFVYSIATDFPPRGGLKPMQGKVRPIHALHRGDLKMPGSRVLPGAPPLWPDAPTQFADQEDYNEATARAELARYVTHRDNPLLYRSVANRLWQWTMGKPIVGTPNDFGRMGLVPTHPRLLDHLAAGLRDDPNQSMKSLVGAIAKTRAYRRASSVSDSLLVEANQAIDSNNDFLWRHDRRRLTAEEIRDTTLAISGVLNPEDRGGPSFQDFVIEHPQHSPHYEYHLHDIDDPSSHRRSIYRFVVRSQPQPMLTTLDCADPSISIARRDESTTALQALTQWNSRFITRMSERFAESLQRQSLADTDVISHGCRLAWGRLPDETEKSVLEKIVFDPYMDREQRLAVFCRVLLNSSAMTYID